MIHLINVTDPCCKREPYLVSIRIGRVDETGQAGDVTLKEGVRFFDATIIIKKQKEKKEIQTLVEGRWLRKVVKFRWVVIHNYIYIYIILVPKLYFYAKYIHIKWSDIYVLRNYTLPLYEEENVRKSEKVFVACDWAIRTFGISIILLLLLLWTLLSGRRNIMSKRCDWLWRVRMNGYRCKIAYKIILEKSEEGKKTWIEKTVLRLSRSKRRERRETW